MSGTVQRAAAKALTERYEALLRVSQTLISIRSSEELFRLLARELRAVMNFHFLRVGIYDENARKPRLTLYGEPGIPLQVPSLPKEDTITSWVYQHQQPLIIPSLDAETRFPVVVEMLKNLGVRSVCALPLTAVHRRLGGVTVSSTETNAYNEVGCSSKRRILAYLFLLRIVFGRKSPVVAATLVVALAQQPQSTRLPLE